MERFSIIKVISGGQTGADMAGLKAAKQLSIATGGTAPRKYKTEKEPNNDLKTVYNLTESHSEDYAVRTEANIRGSHATLVFATNQSSPGTKLTISLCKKNNKRFVLIDPFSDTATENISEFIVQIFEFYKRDIILNIAGNRESKSPGIERKTEALLLELFSELTKK